jgi:hypothetical protein
MEGKHTVYIIWGAEDRVMDELSDYDVTKEEFTDEEVDGAIEELSFATAAELKAFLIGVECGSHYNAYYEATTRDEAREHVRGLIREHCRPVEEEDVEEAT